MYHGETDGEAEAHPKRNPRILILVLPPHYQCRNRKKSSDNRDHKCYV